MGFCFRWVFATGGFCIKETQNPKNNTLETAKPFPSFYTQANFKDISFVTAKQQYRRTSGLYESD